MDDWKDRVLGNQLEQLRPPAFLLYADGQGGSSESRRRSTVIRENYSKVRDFLDEHSYGDLLKMAERLRARRSEMKTRSSELVDSRIFYVRAQYTAFQRKHPKIEADSFPGDTGGHQSLLDEPIGKAWLDEDGGIKSDGGWKVEMRDDHDASKTPLSSMEISLPPEAFSAAHSEAGGSGKINFEKVRSRMDPEDLHSSDRLVFTGDTTWSELIDAFENRLRSFATDKDRVSRVRELLSFRLEIVRVVLSRFDILGEVPEMTQEDARGLADQTDKKHPERVEVWQENAAYLYAFLKEQKKKGERPESISELAESSGTSTRQVWDRLKDRGYGIGQGFDGLVRALEEWAPEFENHYGIKTARKAALPAVWPREHER
ncbi:hypothetical protein GGQ07_001621 [Salinibacter ruber]|jgi:hypothetical protein|uniref:hypothetical protein n=1 Tax=Salinibacter ruber TaxID=146919 RepID=UPI00216A73DB|nr:hypothetical protein [Salinibacter ruber]MCS4180181.1 hypothetical protein [Salinibacter ruber]